LIQNLNKVKLPFEPSLPGQVAALAALEDEAFISNTVNECHSGMQILEKYFKEKGIKTIPSAANFLTLILPSEEEAASFNEYLLHNGFILRHLPGWGLPQCIRLTIGTKEDIQKFVVICQDETEVKST
ncbi:MAG: aminotransferase class I/II-fold pyridoxal phosphate-dependent enzyme, partial [Candidatus Marinimicrobia bacterium]|nr:aminotransferase class I/II-fold pyridoxal phosphate-dependent enzyme [Candidatus Neomarinimicrobiota bacterium]